MVQTVCSRQLGLEVPECFWLEVLTPHANPMKTLLETDIFTCRLQDPSGFPLDPGDDEDSSIMLFGGGHADLGFDPAADDWFDDHFGGVPWPVQAHQHEDEGV